MRISKGEDESLGEFEEGAYNYAKKRVARALAMLEGAEALLKGAGHDREADKVGACADGLRGLFK